MATLHTLPPTKAPLHPVQPSDQPNALSKLLLCSPVRSIDNILLIEELQRQLQQPCQIISHPSQITRPEHCLLLVDCGEVAARDIHHWLTHQHLSQAHCALLNVQPRPNPSHAYEPLVDWPQIKGLFYRQHSRQLLLQGIAALVRGKLWLPRHLCHDFLLRRRQVPRGEPLQRLPSPLTQRERQVLQGIYAGDSNAQMAQQMKLSEHTIKSHLYTAYKKLNVKSRLEASNWLRDHLSLLEQH